MVNIGLKQLVTSSRQNCVHKWATNSIYGQSLKWSSETLEWEMKAGQIYVKNENEGCVKCTCVRSCAKRGRLEGVATE